MPNCYSRLADLKAELQGSGTGTSNDTVLLRVLERVSRALDAGLDRHFYSVLATRVYPADYDPDCQPTMLRLPDDVISITTLKEDIDGDGTYETTLVANTDYVLWPYNRLTHEPARRIDKVTGSWPTQVRRVQLVGKFGYSDETELVTTTTEALDDSETGVDLTAVTNLSAGDTLVIDSEQMDVLSIATLTATVTRGVNGTTAASHLTGATAYRRRFPRDIEQATVMQSARFFRETQTGYGGSIANTELGGFSFNVMYPAIRDLLKPYLKNRTRAV